MIIDIVLLVFLVSAFFIGFRKGAIHSIFAFLAFFFGIMLSLKFSHELAKYFNTVYNISSEFLPLICFLIIFLGVMIGTRILSAVLEKIINIAMLGIFNKLIGSLIWCFTFTLIFSTLLWLLNQVHLISPELKQSSRTYDTLITIAPLIIDGIAKIIPYFESLFDSMERMFDDLSNQNSTALVILLK